MSYTIKQNYVITRSHKDTTWTVTWNGRRVFQCDSPIAESLSYTFAVALEMGITGSVEPLQANSRVTHETYGYLDAFDSYEEAFG